jgi:hypothetical protein
MNHQKILDGSAAYLQKNVGYTEMPKRSSVFMWILAVILYPFNRRFMSDYTTTIFGRIYWPDNVDPADRWRTLWHECVHRKQATRVGEPWFSLSYLFPLPLAVLALGAFWSLWWLCALVFLAPLPAPWRVLWEREAYTITAVCDSLLGVDITTDYYLDYQVQHHTGWGYYKPSWWRSRVTRKVREDIEYAIRIVTGEERTDYTDELIRIVRAS